LEVVNPAREPLLVTPIHVKGKPAKTPLVVRVTNVSRDTVSLRTGGDDESIKLTLRGPGAASVKTAPNGCGEIFVRGRVDSIAPGAHVDLPLDALMSGRRCDTLAHYMTTAGPYELDVELSAHVMPPPTPDNWSERGEPVTLTAPAVRLRAE
jgi:hypothetical protein